MVWSQIDQYRGMGSLKYGREERGTWTSKEVLNNDLNETQRQNVQHNSTGKQAATFDEGRNKNVAF